MYCHGSYCKELVLYRRLYIHILCSFLFMESVIKTVLK